MLIDYFPKHLAVDPATGSVVPGATGTVFDAADTSFSTPLPVTDMAGVPVAALTAGPTGIFPDFKCPGHTQVTIRSGTFVTPVQSLFALALAVIPDPSSAGDGAQLTVTAGEYVLTPVEATALGSLQRTYVRFLDQNGLALPAGSTVTVRVNTLTGAVDDITFERAS